MADTITSASTLKLEAYFSDGDTRTIEIDNPKDNLTKEQINAVAAVGVSTQVILGDKAAAPFVRFNKAKTREVERIKLDLR